MESIARYSLDRIIMPLGFRPTSARPSPLDLDAGDPLSCPSCGSHHVVKNGRTHTGKPNHKCQNCGRQFVQDSQQQIVSAETKKTIDKLLAEKIPLAGIARVVDVSKSWLQQYVNRLYEAVPREIDVSSKSECNLSRETL